MIRNCFKSRGRGLVKRLELIFFCVTCNGLFGQDPRISRTGIEDGSDWLLVGAKVNGSSVAVIPRIAQIHVNSAVSNFLISFNVGKRLIFRLSKRVEDLLNRHADLAEDIWAWFLS